MATWALTETHFVGDGTHFSQDGRKQQERLGEDNKNVFNILTRLKEFRDEEKFCDLFIEVGKIKFRAHKAVFAAWCPKIANIIVSQSRVKEDLTITFQYESVDVFSEFLDYCYSGIIVPKEHTIHSLLDIGRNFNVSPLISLCEDYLKSSLSPANLVSRYITSVKYGLVTLEETVISFIETNLAIVVEQNELLNLRPQDLEVFLSSGKMAHVKQEIKLSLIINWVGYSLLDRNKYLMYLLGQITWDHTVGDLLIQISCTENIFTSNEFCLFQLLQCVVNSTGHHLGPFMTTYPRLYSMHSHMIEELTLPKVFSTTSSRIEDILDIPVSLVASDIEPVVKMKDVEVNTDVDSTYFQEMHAVHDTDIPAENLATETIDDTSQLETEIQLTVKTDGTSGFRQTSSTLTGSVEEVCLDPEKESPFTLEDTLDSEQEKSISKHRRKGRPRKISSKAGKERRGRGRSKRSNNKKETKESVAIDTPVIQEDQATDNVLEIVLENDNNVGVIANGIDTSGSENTPTNNTDNISTDHVETHDDHKEEGKPKIKLSLKLKHLKSTKSRARIKSGIKTSKNLLENKPLKPKSENVFKCTEDNCTFKARNDFKLQRHIESVHNTDVKLDCRHCDYSTNQMRELCFHMKTHFSKVPYYCDEAGCTQKFLRMALLVRHQMTHMNQKPYRCDLCPKSFATMNQLRSHKKLHEGRQFECDICYKMFTTKGVMQQHRAIHFDNKPYLCDTCGFSTKHLSHLVSHRKIHTGDVLHCSIPNCSYSTPKQSHMTQHINTHLNIRNHICQVCGKSFVVRGKLLRHERIHLKEKLFKCKQCDYQTSRTDRMKLHIESHGIKFKKKTFNRPVEDEKPDVDFHELYEKVHVDDAEADELHGLSEQSLVSLADMKPMDAISLAASASMIVDSYGTTRLMMDPISGEAVTNIEDTLTFQQGFERIHTTSFDQL